MYRKIISLFLFFSVLTVHARENIALKAKIVEYMNIVNAENVLDTNGHYAMNCEYNHSYIILDLSKMHVIDSIALKFIKNKKCDNWIKEIRVLGAENKNNYFLLAHFGEHHWIERLYSKFKKSKVRYIRLEITSYEDCEENEYLCLERIEVY